MNWILLQLGRNFVLANLSYHKIKILTNRFCPKDALDRLLVWAVIETAPHKERRLDPIQFWFLVLRIYITGKDFRIFPIIQIQLHRQL